jgi:nitrite reductase/ring-hydroxylating ferredoxin subunit/alkylhydroperoxidase/carboxymuconolactone decarboxylase family protein YurZ
MHEVKMTNDVQSQACAVDAVRSTGRWAATLDILSDLDPAWTEQYCRMATNPYRFSALPQKEVQLIAVGLSAAITNMDAAALRRHVRAALQANATKAEILEVLKMAALLALHSMSLGAPILIEEARAAGKTVENSATKPPTPFCDKMKTIGQWNAAWDPFAELDPLWTEDFISAGTGFYTNGVLPPKFVELISIAFDASITHMYAPGTRRHIKAALALGASANEIMDVLKICVSTGANSLDLGAPILAEEAATSAKTAGEPGFVEALELAELPPGRATTVSIDEKQIALFNVDGDVFATNDSCPHAGGSLGWGILDGKIVKCRSHGLRFDVTTGRVTGGAGPGVASYATKIDSGKIYVKTSAPS